MTFPVFYHPEMSAANVGSYSPSAGKPALVVQDWLDNGLITRSDLIGFQPATRDELALAHDRAFVDGVLDCEIDNGFGNTDPFVAASLPWTTGSMLAAAEYAVTHQCHTISPTSGFHHAGFAHAGGFCTFNGLAVTAAALRKSGMVDKVAILDCDMHYGDGTAEILKRRNMHWVTHHTFGQHFRDPEDIGPGGKHVRDWLLAAIEDCANADVILYQAGADPHVRDPLGGLLTTQMMQDRDRAVARGLRRKPLVWNLAGGYQRDEQGTIKPVLQLHRQTFYAWQQLSWQGR
jgi:acetoin utilization deacetylase AcuC-like enzyme